MRSLNGQCALAPFLNVTTVNLRLFSTSEDKGALAKLVEAIKTNYNDRHEEVSIRVDLMISP